MTDPEMFGRPSMYASDSANNPPKLEPTVLESATSPGGLLHRAGTRIALLIAASMVVIVLALGAAQVHAGG